MRLFYLMLVVALGGCASAVSSGYGQGGRDADGRSYAEARADNKLSAAVTSVLVRERSVPAMGIKVKTTDGVVTLSGSVPSRSAASKAVQLAAAVPGVKRVDNQLSIKR